LNGTAPARPIRVLVVDDHAVVRDGLKMLLESADDIRVVGMAPNGCVALQEAGRTSPDVVLMDVVMPEMNGIEATAQLLHGSPSIRVVMVSMISDVEHVYRALQAGAKGYVLKSSSSKQVINAVRTVHAGRRFLSPGIAESMLDEYLLARIPTSPLDQLSQRERQVLQLLAEGRSTTVIGRLLSLSPKTVDTYRSRMMQKLGISEAASLIKFAIRHCITPPE
jgi:DNA-binding NarL/FixJ family response regulator